MHSNLKAGVNIQDVGALAFLTKRPIMFVLREIIRVNPYRQNEALHFASVKFFEMSTIVTDDFDFDQVLM